MTRPLRVLAEVALVALALVMVLAWPHYTRTELVLGLVAVAGMPLRHVHPRIALLVTLPGQVVGSALLPSLTALVGVGQRVRRPWELAGWIALTAVATNLLNVTQHRVPEWFQWLPTLVYTAGVTVGPVALGALRATQVRLRRSLELLSSARAAELAAQDTSARTQERARIAREVHDAVGHHVALLALEAGVLETTSPDPEVRAAAGRMRSHARSAMDEARTALGLLEVDHDDRAEVDVPGDGATAQLRELVRRARAAGVAVDLDLGPEPGPDDPLTELAPGVQRAAVRVLQEALTNAVKHAPGAAVAVAVLRDERAVRVSVCSGPGVGSVASAVGSGGTGLTGLAERLRVLGGHLDVERAADGGYRVLAELPTGAAPADRP